MVMERPSVELSNVNGKWIVVVRDVGHESVRDFVIKQHAESYLAGQRVRLGLPIGAPIHARRDL